MAKSTSLFKTSVRQLVKFSCSSGDLDHGGAAGPTAAEGQAAHKILQAKRKESEQSEVTVESTLMIDGCQLKVSGRVDLLEDNADLPRIGEIKSCYAPPDKLSDSVTDLHWAQLKVYGYCWLRKLQKAKPEQQLPPISLRLIWINILTDEITIDESQFEFEPLQEFFTAAAQLYIDWMQLIDAHRKQVQKSANDLEFPHDGFREGQRKMAAAVYVTARDKGSLLCEAPTGIGKTISTLFPAMKAIGEKHIQSVAYLTAKNSGRVAANESILNLQNNGLVVSAITITAKKTSCHCSNGSCERNADGRCPLTLGFFDRLPAARQELMTVGVITPDIIDEFAHRYQLCPFELTLQMLPWVTLVICDYNYIFDPLVRLTHFTENAKQYLLLIDEAHNLVDRARSMYSAEIDRHQLKHAATESDNKTDLLTVELNRVIRSVDRWTNKFTEPEHADDQPPATITRAISKCAEALTSTVENNRILTEAQADVAKELYRYLVIEDLFGDQHRTLTISRKHTRNRNTTVKLQCLNATERLAHRFKQFKATVAFSATLRPLHFFKDALGMQENTIAMSLPSPFNAAHQGTFVCHWVDTRYQARERSVSAIVDIANQVYQARRGHYQIYFPSYAFMESVHEAFQKKYPAIPTIIQQRGSSEAQRKAFLDVFDTDNPTLAFAIMGGIFGEGVDYRGDKLIGCIVVGTGLSSIDLQQKLIEQDFSVRGLNGFDYGSRYPGLTRVLQTAGRVIRSETDTGVVVLVDQRFNQRFYHDLFPDHWQPTQIASPEGLQSSLQEFWSTHFRLT